MRLIRIRNTAEICFIERVQKIWANQQSILALFTQKFVS